MTVSANKLLLITSRDESTIDTIYEQENNLGFQIKGPSGTLASAFQSIVILPPKPAEQAVAKEKLKTSLNSGAAFLRHRLVVEIPLRESAA